MPLPCRLAGSIDQQTSPCHPSSRAPPPPLHAGDVATEADAAGLTIEWRGLHRRRRCQDEEEHGLHIRMKVSNRLWCREIDVVLAAGVLSKERCVRVCSPDWWLVVLFCLQ